MLPPLPHNPCLKHPFERRSEHIFFIVKAVEYCLVVGIELRLTESTRPRSLYWWLRRANELQSR
jgi:hypothetical protein